jgi:peptide/nickel transport system permease protein
MSTRRRVLVPLGALVCFALLAVGAPWLAPVPPNAIPADGLIQSLPPTLDHPFGTDPLGRDVLSRMLHGARVSLTVAFLSVALSSLVGTTYGAAAGWIGGRVDTLCMRLLDVALAVPRLLVLLTVSAFWGTLPLGTLVLLLGLTGWYEVARLVRADVRGLRERDFVVAARAIGVREPRILWRHVVPHVWPTLVVTATLGVANTIALEAGLSFLGLGVQPPAASWGTILSDGNVPGGARWWLTVFPGTAIVLAALTCNALGDALRESLAPRQVAA